MEQHQYSCTPFKMWKNLRGQNKIKIFRVQNISGVKNMEKTKELYVPLVSLEKTTTLWFTMA